MLKQRVAKTRKDIRVTLRKVTPSEDEIFYVYALLDPRKKGPWKFWVEEKELVLPYAPFYVGKGLGRRPNAHFINTKKKSHKNHTIREIQAAGHEPIIHKLSRLTDELTALALEAIVIEELGRVLTGTGMLTNVADGGFGCSGTKWSSKAKAKVSKQRKIRWAETPEWRKQEIIDKRRAGIRAMTPEAKEEQQRRKSEAMRRFEEGLSERERMRRREKGRLVAKAFADQESPESKAKRAAKRKKTVESKSLEEKAEIAKKIGAGARKYWEGLSDKDYAKIKKQRKQTTKETWLAQKDSILAKREATNQAKSVEEKERERQKRSSSMRAAKANRTEEEKASTKAQAAATRAARPTVTCPHCGTCGRGGNMTRHHFDKCRLVT